MGLSFYGPSQNNPHVEIVRRAGIDGALMERMMLSCDEINALHAHVHGDDPNPKVAESVPPWCPTFDGLRRAKAALRRIATVALARNETVSYIEMAQAAMDALGGGPVLKDDLDLDDDGGAAESSAAEDAEHQQRRTER